MKPTSHAFTLLETLAVLSILAMLFALLWGIIAGFSGSRTRSLQRNERSQLVRSLAQLLADDLAAAIQDPVQGVLTEQSGDDAIRRFGLLGTDRTLRIDVIAIDPFAPVASDDDNNQRYAAMGQVNAPASKVPELKTVFYNFTVANTEATAQIGATALSTESLNLPTVPTEQYQVKPEWYNNSQLVGLTRRELDFETSVEAVKSYGSLNANEVIDGQFRYFDGNNWHNDWNSITQKGLPSAIETVLQLKPFTTNTAPEFRRMIVYLPTASASKQTPFARNKPKPAEPTNYQPQVIQQPAVQQPSIVQQPTVQQPSIETQSQTPANPPEKSTEREQDWIRH
jgi:type II secretory pathway pseudopilin PulG